MTDTDSAYGRTEAEWAELIRVGRQFLIEQARLGAVTSYTELNAVLVRRSGVRPFELDHQTERAAMGHLLGRIVAVDRPESGLMLSALVKYLNENDAGPGFYKLAQELGDLRAGASADEKLAFWTDQMRSVHEHHRRRH